MPKLRVVRNEITYHGFFVEPAFELMGDIRSLVTLLYQTFAPYGASLSSFRLGDSQDLSETMMQLRLGSRGVYRFKFDQAQAVLSDFTDDQQLVGFVEMIQAADEKLRGKITNLKYSTHAFFYNGHCESDSKPTNYLRGLWSDSKIVPPGEDHGSGIILNWHDRTMDANVSLTLDHSLQIRNGLFVSYRVLLDRDQLDYVPLSVYFRSVFYDTLANLGLEIDEGQQT